MEQDITLKAGEEAEEHTDAVTAVQQSTTENAEAAVVDDKKEIPEIDFGNLSGEEIVAQAKKLTDEYLVGQLKSVFDALPEIFEARYQKEYNKALSDYVEAGNAPETFECPNNLKEQFQQVYKIYKDKKTQQFKKSEEEREQNLKIKLRIIEGLKELVQKEEALNKTFQEFRELQEQWRNTGMVPQQNLNGLLESYHLHLENFYNYIKINKELRDLDLKYNLDAKEKLCEEAEKLNEGKDINDSFRQLQQLHARWKEIGPVPKEQKEPVWERFRTATGKINEEHHKFLESLRKEQDENLQVKEEICTKAQAIADTPHNTLAEWNDATKNILELQEEWKHSGTIPQKERNNIYKKFRNSCDQFFNKKREFYKQMQDGQEKNLELKMKLCEKVEAIKDNTDWKVTTDKIISLQKEWKKIGPAPKKSSNKIWARFRAACDTFFNNKAEHFKDIDSEQGKNLEFKKALIEELKQFELTGNNEQNLSKLKDFQQRWTTIGFVPIKQKDALQEEFRGLVNAHFDKLDLGESDKNIERFRAKMNTIDGVVQKDYKIVQEREKLVAKIRQVESDVHVLENNIGFISKSSKSEGLIKELENKIEQSRERLSMLNEKLKIIDNMI